MSPHLAAVVVTGVSVLTAGCATKRDLQDLTAQVELTRSTQQEMLQEVIRQNELLLDSLSSQQNRQQGEQASQLHQVETQLLQIQELMGQSQRRLGDLRERLERRAEGGEWNQEGGDLADLPPARDLFEASMEALRRGSLATARAGFEEFLRLYPDHPLASEAQFQIGEAHSESGEREAALDAYARLLERYPNSEKAPTSMYRAGLLEEERGNAEAAALILSRLVAAYPDSPEATLARERLDQP